VELDDEPVAAARYGPAELLATVRVALAVVLGLRLALSPFAAAVGQPDVLWRPRGTGLVFSSPPPVALVVALQVVGAAGAALFLRRRRLAPLVVAWGCLLLLAGLRTSLGKILHNDVLLLLAAGPLLLAGNIPPESEPDRRLHGSSEPAEPDRRSTGSAGAAEPDRLLTPPRHWWYRSPRAGGPIAEKDARTALDASAAIVLVSYLSAGWWKLVRSGPAWAFSDNLRWSLAAGRGGSNAPALTRWLIDHPPVCVALACGLLAVEVGAPLVWLRPRLVPWFVAATTLMHAGTWLVFGLDYWAHLATVVLVLLPWARMRTR